MKKRIGPYRIEKLLGHGGSAAVYLGRHSETHEQVAIKLLHLFTPEEQAQATFRREVEVIQRLKHPGIIQILDLGIDEETPYFTMPYISGGNLRMKHPRGEQIPLKTVQTYLQLLAPTLQYAHEHKIIHLDIKPENILVTPDDQLILSDFGIARIIHTSRSLTTQDPGGTLVYKAPEQFQGKPVPASDQYALAIMIYEWLCGEPPFLGNTHERLLEQHLFASPPLLREKKSSIPEQVENIILRALAKRPAERFSDMETFAATFCRALEDKSLEEVFDVPNVFRQNENEDEKDHNLQKEIDRYIESENASINENLINIFSYIEEKSESETKVTINDKLKDIGVPNTNVAEGAKFIKGAFKALQWLFAPKKLDWVENTLKMTSDVINAMTKPNWVQKISDDVGSREKKPSTLQLSTRGILLTPERLENAKWTEVGNVVNDKGFTQTKVWKVVSDEHEWIMSFSVEDDGNKEVYISDQIK